MKPGTINPESLKIVRDKIHNACENVGRNVDEVQIVAVTKTFGIEAINSALDFGISFIGENKVQEVEQKIPMIQNLSNIEIHFIGHLQSNKVRKVLQLVNVIETIDSIKLAKRVNNISEELNKMTEIFLQINAANDPAKIGFQKSEILEVASQISQFKNIKISGIMTVPPQSKDMNLLKTTFNATRKFRDKIQSTINGNCKSLSMGMSGDFETAIECGATHIRLGTILFGKRVYN